MRDFQNPFTNAKVVGVNHAPAEHHTSPAKRGEKAFVMTRSALMDFMECPHKWFHGYARKTTEEMEWGSLMDVLVLTPTEFALRYAVTPATYPATPKKKGDAVEQKPWNRNSTYCAEWEEQQVGKTVIKAELYGRAFTAIGQLTKDAQIAAYLHACNKRQVRVTADYLDADTGLRIPVAVLIDLLPDVKHKEFGKTIGDLKTGTSAAPSDWEKQVYYNNYDAQAAMYLDVYAAATGEDRETFCHVIQENYAPYETGKRILSAEFVEIGRLKYLNALRAYCQCVKTGHWYGYDDAPGARTWNGWRFAQPQLWMIQ